MMNSNFFAFLTMCVTETKLDFLAGSQESLASLFGSLTRKDAELLYGKLRYSSHDAMAVLEMLKKEGFAKPASGEIQTIEDSVIVKTYNLLWAVALIDRCENPEAFANRLFGRTVTQTQGIKKIAAMESFIVANMPKNENRENALQALARLRNEDVKALPERANKAWSADMRQASKVLKTRIVKASKSEALSPEQEIESLKS